MCNIIISGTGRNPPGLEWPERCWASLHLACPPWCPKSEGRSYTQSAGFKPQIASAEVVGLTQILKPTNKRDIIRKTFVSIWWKASCSLERQLKKVNVQFSLRVSVCFYPNNKPRERPMALSGPAFGTKLRRVRITSVRLNEVHESILSRIFFTEKLAQQTSPQKPRKPKSRLSSSFFCVASTLRQ